MDNQRRLIFVDLTHIQEVQHRLENQVNQVGISLESVLKLSTAGTSQSMYLEETVAKVKMEPMAKMGRMD
jgi:hypothetical protein